MNTHQTAVTFTCNFKDEWNKIRAKKYTKRSAALQEMQWGTGRIYNSDIFGG